MLALNLFLAHSVADYSFTNPMKLYGQRDRKELLKHFLWIVLVFLAFTFDITFHSITALTVFFAAVALHFIIDFLRIRKKNQWVVEAVSFGGFLILSIIFSQLFKNSYITPYFSLYLIGMVTVSVIPTQFMRMTGIIEKEAAESDGISERLAIYIFICAGRIWFALIAVAVALIYRLIIRKKVEKEWWISPLLGLTIPWIFKLFIFG